MTQEKLSKQADLIKEYNDTLAIIEKFINNSDDPNQVINDLQNMNDIWDAKSVPLFF